MANHNEMTVLLVYAAVLLAYLALASENWSSSSTSREVEC
jgi:hypothetical protein